MFAEISDKEIDMIVEDSVKYDLVKPETQAFDEMFPTVSTVKCDPVTLSRLTKCC